MQIRAARRLLILLTLGSAALVMARLMWMARGGGVNSDTLRGASAAFLQVYSPFFLVPLAHHVAGGSSDPVKITSAQEFGLMIAGASLAVPPALLFFLSTVPEAQTLVADWGAGAVGLISGALALIFTTPKAEP